MRRYQQDQQIEATVFSRHGRVLHLTGSIPDVCRLAIQAMIDADPGAAHEPETDEVVF